MLDAAADKATTETLLEVNNIEVIYNHVILVLKGVSLNVPKGGITALLGGNGAGKTTTLKAISGLLKSERGEVTKGSIQYRGRDHPASGPRRYRQGRRRAGHGRPALFRTPDRRGKPADRRLYAARRQGCDRRPISRWSMTTFPRLKERRKSQAGYTSGGEQQMTAIGRALMSRPETILLDEPSMGLAPQLVEQIFEIVKSVNENEGVTFLLAEQNTNVALRFAHYGYILESGRVVMDGPARELRENPDVKEFYLGMSEEGRKSFRDVRSYRRRKRWLS